MYNLPTLAPAAKSESTKATRVPRALKFLSVAFCKALNPPRLKYANFWFDGTLIWNLSQGEPRTLPPIRVASWYDVGRESEKSLWNASTIEPFELVATLGSYQTFTLLSCHVWNEGAIPPIHGIFVGWMMNVFWVVVGPPDTTSITISVIMLPEDGVYARTDMFCGARTTLTLGVFGFGFFLFCIAFAAFFFCGFAIDTDKCCVDDYGSNYYKIYWCVLDPATKRDCTLVYTWQYRILTSCSCRSDRILMLCSFPRRAVQSLGILFSTEVLSHPWSQTPFWAFMYTNPMFKV